MHGPAHGEAKRSAVTETPGRHMTQGPSVSQDGELALRKAGDTSRTHLNSDIYKFQSSVLHKAPTSASAAV